MGPVFKTRTGPQLVQKGESERGRKGKELREKPIRGFSRFQSEVFPGFREDRKNLPRLAKIFASLRATRETHQGFLSFSIRSFFGLQRRPEKLAQAGENFRQPGGPVLKTRTGPHKWRRRRRRPLKAPDGFPPPPRRLGPEPGCGPRPGWWPDDGR